MLNMPEKLSTDLYLNSTYTYSTRNVPTATFKKTKNVFPKSKS